MDTTQSKQFASEIFDTFIAICTKYKIDFSVLPGNKEIKTTRPAKGNAAAASPDAVVAPKATTSSRRKPAPDKAFDFIKWFCTTPTNELYKVKRGQWACSLESGVWQLTFNMVNPVHSHAREASWGILAFRPLGRPDMVMMNGGRFGYQGRMRWGVTEPQKIAMDATAMPIPLRLIMGNKPEGLAKKLKDVRVIEWSGQEEIIINDNSRRNYYAPKDYWLEKRHFAGAALITIGDEYFLMDVDRQELDNFRFNAFFTRLPGAVKTINGAYASLIPPEVIGSDFSRQGELFFKPQDEAVIKARMKECAWEMAKPTFDNTYDMLMSLAAPVAAAKLSDAVRSDWYDIEKVMDTDPIITANPAILDKITKLYSVTHNYAENLRESADKLDTFVNPVGFAGSFKLYVNQNIEHFLNPSREDTRQSRWGGRHCATLMFMPAPGELYAFGVVTHNQHYPLNLKQWCRVYKNTATGAWNITGDAD